MNAHILIVDDEEDILELVEYTLKRAKFSCTRAVSGTEAIQAAQDAASMPAIRPITAAFPFTACSIISPSGG